MSNMALTAEDVSKSALVSSTIETTLALVHLRTRWGWHSGLTSVSMLDSDKYTTRKSPWQVSTSMSFRDFLDAAGEAILKMYDLEVRAAKLQEEDPRYILSAVCMINHRGLDEHFSALVALSEDSWNGALQLMQATPGEVEILIQFGKKKNLLSKTGCTVQ